MSKPNSRLNSNRAEVNRLDNAGYTASDHSRYKDAPHNGDSLFKAAFENAAVGCSIADIHGNFVSVNKAFCNIVGYNEEELLALSIKSITVAGDQSVTLDAFARMRRDTSNSAVYEKRYARKDGRIVWVQNSASIIGDNFENPEFVLALTEDITDRKEAQKARQIAEEHTASLLNLGSSLGEAITTAQVLSVILSSALSILTADTGLVALTSEADDTLNIAVSAGMPESFCETWTGVPKTANNPLAISVRERKLLVFAYDEKFVEQNPGAEGISEPSTNVLLCLPMLVGDRELGCIGVWCSTNRCRDVEEKVFMWAVAGQCAQALERARLYDEARREVEDRLRAEDAKRESEAKFYSIVESSSVAYAVSDNGRFTFLNSEFTRTFGYTIEDIPTWEEWFQFAFPDSEYRERERSRTHRVLDKAMSEGTDFPASEVTIRCKDGTDRTIIANARSLGATFPKIYVINFSDITERKLIEQERERLLVEAQARADLDPLTGLLNHRAFYNRLDSEAARAKREKSNIAVVMLDLDNFKFFNDVYGHAIGDEVLQIVARKLQSSCRLYDTIARFGGDEFALLISGIEDATVDDIEKRLRSNLCGVFYRVNEQNTTIPVSISLGAAIFPDADSDCREVLRKADERLRWSKTGGAVEESAQHIRTDAGNRVHGFSMLDALVTAVDNKDRYTRKHSEDVMEYSLMIYRELGLDDKAQRIAAIAALLHDVGKIGVPDAILRKPGKLTTEEFEAIKQHPQMGAVMVGSVPGLEETLPAVRHHHERWDGKGYPCGLKGEETPLIARVMAVADAFSAMTTDRPYRKGMDRAIALAIISAGAGEQWDPICVDAFLKSWNQTDILDKAA